MEGPVGMKVLLDPTNDLAADIQRNESNLRSMKLANIRPAPDMLAIYGVVALAVSVGPALQGSVLGVVVAVSGLVDVLGILMIPRRGAPSSGYYAVGAVGLNVVSLSWASAGASLAQPADLWTAFISVLALAAFGAYPALLIRRNWGYFAIHR